MAITNGFATLAEFKARFYPSGLIDITDDTVIENAIEAVSRLIDGKCSRRFWKNTVDETRYFTANYGDLFYTDDIVSITTLKTDETGARSYSRTWAVTDYDLEPYNALLQYPVQPYTSIRVSPMGTLSFPFDRKAVQIVGVFGWPAVPDTINEACLLQSIRLFKRKDAPFGVTGSAEMGHLIVIPKLDPDVEMLIAPYRRLSIGAV
jgi:hypothetical protein